MKTGGSTLLYQAVANEAREAIWGPALDPDTDDFERLDRYTSVDRLRAMGPDERRAYRVFMGHVPFSAAELAPPRTLIATVLRDPVSRTLSYLGQCATFHYEHRGMALEEVYEDEYFFPRFIADHQTKMLSMSLEDALQPPPPPPPPSPEVLAALAAQNFGRTAQFAAALVDNPLSWPLEVDDARLAVAKANLERTDLLGLHEEYDDFVARVGERMGWSIDPAIRANVGAQIPVSSAFRRRIEKDNERDMALYEHARELLAACATRRSG
jgi:hypothetical protein